MATVDLSPLLRNDSGFERAVSDVVSSYKGDWSDKIHDSYLTYVKQLQEQSQKVHAIRCKTETLRKEAEALHVDELLRKADSLCKEADSIC